MKRKLMMVSVLGIIALVLGFLLIPAATTVPIGMTEGGSDMPIGTEVVLGDNTTATYLGETPTGSYKWQATFNASASDACLYKDSGWRNTKDDAWIHSYYSDFATDVKTGNMSAAGVGFHVCLADGSGICGYSFVILRAPVYFPDTSALPDDCNVTAATLNLYKANLSADFCPWILQIQSGMPTRPYDPPDTSDYSYRYYSGNGGTISSNSIGSGYNIITLTEEGKSWINKTGTTKFMLRDGTFDIPGGYQSEKSSKTNAFGFYTRERGTAYCPKLVVTYETPPPQPLLEKYSPVLYFHPYESYFVDPINSMLNESGLMLWYEDTDNGTFNRTFILSNPTESQLSSHNSNQYYTDVRNSEPGYGLILSDGSFYNICALPPESSRFGSYPFTVYGRQLQKTYQGDDYIVLQYWLFYPYNRWWNCHEGDMERVQIICNGTTGNPERMTFGQHWGGETVTWDPANITFMSGTHPEVFVGVGSHSSWPTSGNHIIASFLNDMITLTDYTSNSGTALFPDCLSSAWNSYSLVDISNEPPWTKWLGTWGYFMPGPAGGLGMCGPDSPANVRVNHINVWNDPIAWANNPGSPSVITQATGSVRLHAYDSNGNHTGLNETTGEIETQIPGTYFYVPASNQSEAELMWIYTEDKNLTFTLEATGTGESNFSFVKCQSDVVCGNFTNIEVTQNTTATVNTELAPLSVMQIDIDGDGRIDQSKFPDSANTSTLIGKVSFAGRGDPPNDRWIETFMVRFFDPSTHEELSWSQQHLYATTNSSGYFTLAGIPPGTYDIGIKSYTSLSEMVYGVTLNGS